jgi:hypothetical protein
MAFDFLSLPWASHPRAVDNSNYLTSRSIRRLYVAQPNNVHCVVFNSVAHQQASVVVTLVVFWPYLWSCTGGFLDFWLVLRMWNCKQLNLRRDE